MKLFKQPQHVIFDMDGLMFDTEALCFICEQEAAAEYGYTVDKELYLQTLGVNQTAYREIMLAHFGAGFPVQKISELTYQKMDARMESEGVPVKPGLITLLDGLSSMEIRCSVASSSRSVRVRRMLAMAGISSYFPVVIGGEMTERSKPEPDIFLKACETAGFTPESSLVLEDSPNGLLAAHRAGIPAVCIPDLTEPPASVLKLACSVLPRLDMVLDLLQP